MPEFLAILLPTLLPILLLVICGACSGFLAGLLGVGGGILLVPALFWVIHSFGISDFPMQVAVATSLANILFTGSRSAWAHYRQGNVDVPAVKIYAPPITLGTGIGVMIALHISSLALQMIFGVIAILLAGVMLMKPIILRDGLPRAMITLPMVTLFGLISSLVGIGGGSLVVPSLTAFGYPLLRAIGSAAALGVCIALPGTIGFALLAGDTPALSRFGLGFIWLPGLALTALTSVLAAPWGSRVAGNIAPALLRHLFALFLMLVGAKLLLHAAL